MKTENLILIIVAAIAVVLLILFIIFLVLYIRAKNSRHASRSKVPKKLSPLDDDKLGLNF